jgi:hypothetical protein
VRSTCRTSRRANGRPAGRVATSAGPPPDCVEVAQTLPGNDSDAERRDALLAPELLQVRTEPVFDVLIKMVPPPVPVDLPGTMVLVLLAP